MALYGFHSADIFMRDKLLRSAQFRGLTDGHLFEGWAFIRGERLFDNHESRMGAYFTEVLNRDIQTSFTRHQINACLFAWD